MNLEYRKIEFAFRRLHNPCTAFMGVEFEDSYKPFLCDFVFSWIFHDIRMQFVDLDAYAL